MDSLKFALNKKEYYKEYYRRNKWRWIERYHILTGEGSGSKKDLKASNYKHGRSCFRRWAKERKLKLQQCERCQCSLLNVTSYQWAGHHKDHNSTNNTIINLEVLCKRCHQIEHKCWKQLNVTTR